MTIDCPFFEVLTRLPFQSETSPAGSSKITNITSFQSFSPIKGESQQFPITTFKSQKTFIEGISKEEKEMKKNEEKERKEKKGGGKEKEKEGREEEGERREIKRGRLEITRREEEDEVTEEEGRSKNEGGYIEKETIRKEKVKERDPIKKDIEEDDFCFFEAEKRFDRHGFKRRWINEFEESYFKKEISITSRKPALTFKEIFENYPNIRDHAHFLKTSHNQEYETFKLIEIFKGKEGEEEVIHKKEEGVRREDEKGRRTEEERRKEEKVGEGGRKEEEIGREERKGEQPNKCEDYFLKLFFELKNEKKRDKEKELEGKEKEKKVMMDVISFLRKDQRSQG